MFVTSRTVDRGMGFRNPLKSLEKSVRKVINRDPVFRAVKKVDTKIKKEVARSKIAQGVLYTAGAIAAPFTGGASLAVAAAAVQSSKAAAKGRSFGAQIAQGLGAGAVGWVAGVGLVYGAGALGVGPAATAGQGASFLTPFGTAAASVAPSAAALPFGVAPVAAATGSSFLSTFGQTAAVGALLARGLKGGGITGAIDAGMVAAGVNPNLVPTLNRLLPDGWSSGADAGGGGGGGAPPGGGPDPYDNPTQPTLPFSIKPYMPFIAAGLGAAVLLYAVRKPLRRKFTRRS